MGNAAISITLTVVFVNALAVVLGRLTHDRATRTAFISGVAGLCVFPLGCLAAVMEFVPPPLDGPEPVLLLATIAALSVATFCSFVSASLLLTRRRPRPNNSSKPTPLRGAA